MNSFVTPSVVLFAPSLRRRMACWLYESLLLFGLVFIGGILLGFLGLLFGHPVSPQILQGALFVVVGIYFSWFWSKRQTLAMKTWGIAVVDNNGRTLTPIRALARYALSWMWLLPPLAISHFSHLQLAQTFALTAAWILLWSLLCWLHPQRQFIHDVLAGTRLVNCS